MKTTISLSTPAELETESLAAVVLDHAEPAPNEKDKKPQLKVASTDAAVQAAAADLLASGEVTGKPCETNLLHKPAGVEGETPPVDFSGEAPGNLPVMICGGWPALLCAR